MTASRTTRVLLVKRDKLGDLLLATAVIAYLKAQRPDLELHLLANDYNAWVAQDHPALARTWIYPRVRQGGRIRVRAALAQLPLAVRLRAAKFDWAIALGGDESHRATRRGIATGARRVVAYSADPGAFSARLTDPLPVPQGGHEITRMAALLAPLGVGAPAGPLLPSYGFPQAGDPFVAAWLAERGLVRGGYVVLGLGARRAKKQPTAEQIERWTTRFAGDFDLPTVFMWTPGSSDNPEYPGDDAIAQPVLARDRSHLHPYRGPIPAALGLIANARTSLFPDSGLMHFAAASQGGVLGFFADPADSAPAERWAPAGLRARFLEAESTVAQLPDETVFAALTPLLRAC